MKLSVIIVNYNVKYFLEQCLISVQRASAGLEVETFVVDNNSVDGSVAMVKARFPWVKLIANADNPGFSVANNQAIKQSTGEYVLLLNPDTIVEEDTFTTCVKFMDRHLNAGGLGVRMVDGKGNFLPESKRGLPTPEVAFYKIFGLSALFPKSKRFGAYHLGYLDEHENHKVDILAGAFMWMRKSVLDEVGLLDETFFMYGEDIDLSHRIRLAGYDNYYLSDTRIIHYKGESTKKGSLNYVFVFYNAMIIFAEKHFTKSGAGVFRVLIKLAIYFRATIAIIRRAVEAIALPFLDAVLSSGLLYLFTHWYQIYGGTVYPEDLVKIALPSYVLVLLGAIYLNGGYDKPFNPKSLIKGAGLGTLALLLIYGLFSQDWRFSRFIVFAAGFITLTGVFGIRLLLQLFNVEGYDLFNRIKKRFGIIGRADEFQRVKSLLSDTGIHPDFVLEISPDEIPEKRDSYLGKIADLPEIVEAFKLNEIIFCLKDLSGDGIISQMTRMNRYNLEYKIAPPESSFIIGSNSVNNPGEFYSFLAVNNIGTPANKRQKRLLDVTLSLMLLLISPVFMWMQEKPAAHVSTIFKVLAGKLTWVGYNPLDTQKNILPKIRNSVLPILITRKKQNKKEDIAHRANFNYANRYSIRTDLQQIWKERYHLFPKS